MVFIPCSKCDSGWLINEETEEATECECLIKFQHTVEAESIILKSNLPLKIKDYEISSYIGNDEEKNLPKLQKFISSYQEKFKNIHLWVVGTNSTQKTTVSSWVGKEIARKGNTVYYTTMQQLVQNLWSFSFDEKLIPLVSAYNESDLLIIDEAFDETKVNLWKSGAQLPCLDSFLRTRLESLRKSTIFVSNIQINDIPEKFGFSMRELINRNCHPLEFKDSINLKNDFDVEDLWK